MSRTDVEKILDSIGVSIQSKDLSEKEVERVATQLTGIDVVLKLLIGYEKQLNPVEKMMRDVFTKDDAAEAALSTTIRGDGI